MFKLFSSKRSTPAHNRTSRAVADQAVVNAATRALYRPQQII